MTEMDATTADILASLRTGVVPPAGLGLFAVGLERLTGAIQQELEELRRSPGQGRAKWIRGEYGSGKTFASRLIGDVARAQGFATAEAQVSINDTPLHHLETVYRRLIERLTTAADGSGALQAIVDAWLYQLGEQVTALQGLAEDDPTFAAAVDKRLEERLALISSRNAAFAQVLRAYHQAIQQEDYRTAQGLLAWLGGQPHIDRSVLSKAGVKGSVDGQAALTFLRGLLLLLQQTGYAGLVVVLDEVETIQRMPGPTREKALNALRQLVDALASGELPGMYLLVTGTPDFFDGYKGLKGLQPLLQRVSTRFEDDARFDNLRAPQVRLPAFDRERLLRVGQRVRELFTQGSDERVARAVDDAFLRGMVEEITRGFGGKISVCPRIFLRELVDVLDRVDQHPDYDPRGRYQLRVDEAELRPQELAARRGEDPEDAEGEVPAVAPPTPRRLDG